MLSHSIHILLLYYRICGTDTGVFDKTLVSGLPTVVLFRRSDFFTDTGIVWVVLILFCSNAPFTSTRECLQLTSFYQHPFY